MTGFRLLMAAIISLLVCPVVASDSLLTVREVAVKTYQLLSLDTSGVADLDSALMHRFATDGSIRAYTDLGDPKAKKIAITKDLSAYEVDAAMISIRGIVFDTNQTFRALREVFPERLNDLTYYSNLEGAVMRPSYYIRHGDSVVILPTPKGNDSIYVFYFARGKFPYADTVAVVIPSEYRMAAIYATMIYCQLRMDNYEKVEFLEKLYATEIIRLRSRFEFADIKK